MPFHPSRPTRPRLCQSYMMSQGGNYKTNVTSTSSKLQDSFTTLQPENFTSTQKPLAWGFLPKHPIACLKLFLIRVNKFHRISILDHMIILDHEHEWCIVTLRTVESELPLSCCRFMSISPKHRAESQTQTPDSLSKQRSTPMTSSSVKLTKETHEPCNIQFQWDKWTRKLGAPPELLYSRQHAWRAVGTHTILSCEKYVYRYIYIYTCKPH